MDTIERQDNGFEYGGEFYRWKADTNGKALWLIDRFAAMPVAEFFEIIDDEDNPDRGRTPILLALIATSIAGAHQDWSVERISRMVWDLDLSDVEFITTDAEAQPVPPASAGERPATGSESSSGESSPSSTPEES